MRTRGLPHQFEELPLRLGPIALPLFLHITHILCPPTADAVGGELVGPLVLQHDGHSPDEEARLLLTWHRESNA